MEGWWSRATCCTIGASEVDGLDKARWREPTRDTCDTCDEACTLSARRGSHLPASSMPLVFRHLVISASILGLNRIQGTLPHMEVTYPKTSPRRWFPTCSQHSISTASTQGSRPRRGISAGYQRAHAAIDTSEMANDSIRVRHQLHHYGRKRAASGRASIHAGGFATQHSPNIARLIAGNPQRDGPREREAGLDRAQTRSLSAARSNPDSRTAMTMRAWGPP